MPLYFISSIIQYFPLGILDDPCLMQNQITLSSFLYYIMIIVRSDTNIWEKYDEITIEMGYGSVIIITFTTTGKTDCGQLKVFRMLIIVNQKQWVLYPFFFVVSCCVTCIEKFYVKWLFLLVFNLLLMFRNGTAVGWR